jgi:hypothetical protein
MPMEEQTRTKVILGGSMAAVLLAVGVYFWLRSDPPPVEAPVVQETAPPEQAPHYEVPGASAPENAPLPALAESDSALLEGLKGLFTGEALQQYLVPNDIVRRAVVTIDNLPRKKVAERLKPVKPIDGSFKVAGTDEALTLDPANAERYRALMQLVSITDMDQVAAVYFKFYPLFQESYKNLGYPNGYFNNRLVEVIDHLLATPNVEGPIKLTQPGVMYEFADPKLEALSAGQKTLIRMGNENAATIKGKLRELRSAVTKQAADQKQP